MAKWWYYDENGDKVGPVRGRDLKRLARTGSVTQDTLVVTEEEEILQAKLIEGLKFAETPPIVEENVAPFITDEIYGFDPLPSESTSPSLTPAPQIETNPGSSIEDISAIDTTDTWFYYDINALKRGPYDKEQLARLAKAGAITPETFVELPNGRSRPAKSVGGLVFAETIQQAIALRKQRRLCVIALGLILAVFSFTGVWRILLIAWLVWGVILAIVLFPMMAMHSASKAADMFD